MLDEDLPTLAERFAAAGYDTACISANYMLSEELGMSRGFEHLSVPKWDDEAVVREVQELLAQPRERPLFLYVNLFRAHDPFELEAVEPASRWSESVGGAQTPEWLRPYLRPGIPEIPLYTAWGESVGGGNLALDVSAGRVELDEAGRALVRDVYLGEVRRVDFELNQVLGAWNASGRSSGVVAVTSDHGEHLGERGRLAHGRDVYPELLRIPMVLVAPGLPAQARVTEAVELRQLHDTLLQLAGVEAPTRGLLPFIEGATRSEPLIVNAWPDEYWARVIGGPFAVEHRFVREGDLAAIEVGERVQLYELSQDPGMWKDLAADRPQDAQRLATLGRAARGTEQATPLELDEDAIRALQAMGYLEGPSPEEVP